MLSDMKGTCRKTHQRPLCETQAELHGRLNVIRLVETLQPVFSSFSSFRTKSSQILLVFSFILQKNLQRTHYCSHPVLLQLHILVLSPLDWSNWIYTSYIQLHLQQLPQWNVTYGSITIMSNIIFTTLRRFRGASPCRTRTFPFDTVRTFYW